MRVGIPTEIKDNEFRVAVTPAGAHALVEAGHDVVIEHGAGLGSGIADDDYRDAGARLVDVDSVWAEAELLLKVKEPIAAEYPRFRPDQTIFTYLHLAANRPLAEALIASGTTALAYETVRTASGALPLLAPMSEIAGRLAVHAGIYHLQRPLGGRGVLASGVPGVPPAEIVIIGGGAAGENALRQAIGIGARATVLDVSVARLRDLDRQYGSRVQTIHSSAYAIEQAVIQADLVVGAVLIPGARAPKLVSHDLVTRMKPGAVLVDIAIDQGGCFEDSHPTTHSDPVFTVGDTLFYCVANMPGAVPVTSTVALTNATLPYVAKLAELGWERAATDTPDLAGALTVHDGRIVTPEVAATFDDLPH